MTRELRSIITCDMEGRIETYNEGAEALFGYAPAEVIGQKRVSIFSPGLIVLGHVNAWLAEARKQGGFRTRTVFVKKDGTPFAAEIQITPTYRRHNGEKQQIGYCGMTSALPDVSPAEVMPPIGWPTRLMAWLVITRAPFLTATLMPVLIAAAWAAVFAIPGPFPWLLFASTLLGASSLQIAANTFNDYFDWRSGTDPANRDYFVPYTGGSRSIELGLIDEARLLRIACVALVTAAVTTVPILLARGPLLIVLGLLGAALAYFYTAPPLRLAARRGLGELSIILGFGPLLTTGTVYALVGEITSDAFLIGLPIGFLAGAILWINEFPDADADAMTGKHNLLVTVGKENARWVYVLLLGLAFFSASALIVAGRLPVTALAIWLGLPLAVYASRVLFGHFRDRELVKANRATIRLHAACGLLLTLGILSSA